MWAAGLCAGTQHGSNAGGLFHDAPWRSRRGHHSQRQSGVRHDLPVYLCCLCCGADNPLNDSRRNIERRLSAYRAAGLKVDSRIYPGYRHEMLNGINRGEVMDDLVVWLDKQRSA